MSRFRTRSGFVIVAVAAMVVAACGSSSKKTAGSTSATTSAANAANATPIKIGVLLPESGPSAANGAQHKFLLDTITKEPGHDKIDGHPVSITTVDDQGTATGGAAGAHELIDQDHVSVIIGSNLTGVATS